MSTTISQVWQLIQIQSIVFILVWQISEFYVIFYLALLSKVHQPTFISILFIHLN